MIDSLGFEFGCIAIKFVEPFEENTAGDQLDLLISYLDFLKEQFEIKSSLEYGKGHTIESDPQAQGVINYWKDADGIAYSIKGWISPTGIGVMYLDGEHDYPFLPVEEMFLNGFRFK